MQSTEASTSTSIVTAAPTETKPPSGELANALLGSYKVSTVTAIILQTEIVKHKELESRAQEGAGSGPRGPSPALTPCSTTRDQLRLGGSDPAL